MNESKEIKDLIPIEDRNGQKAVSARMLHAFLESKQEFANWIKNRIDKYGFVENVDYSSFDNIIKRENGATVRKEYALSINMAKELSMVEGNEKGKQARRYFIKCEEMVNGSGGLMSELLVLQKSVNALVEHENRIAKVESRLDALDKEREENTKDLLALPISDERVPEMSLRAKVRKLVNEYAYMTNIRQQEVWHKVYEQLFYLYKISIRAYKKQKGETNLDVAERNGFLDKIHIVISNLVKEYK